MARIKIGLAKEELAVLREVANGKSRVEEIAKVLEKSRRQIYRLLQNLKKTGFIEKKGKEIVFQKQSFIPIFAKVMRVYPNIVNVLAGSGMIIFKELLEPRSIGELKIKTGLGVAIIHRKIREARRISLVIKEGKKYKFNNLIWPDLKEFFQGYSMYYLRIAQNIDANILIRGKYDGVLVVESNKELLDASLTAFSLYSQYGIGILMPVSYYHFPRENLNIKQVFHDSLVILEDDFEYRKALYTILFYLKNKVKLKDFKHELIYKLQKVLKGEIIKDFPSLKDIKEKAEQYDVQI